MNDGYTFFAARPLKEQSLVPLPLKLTWTWLILIACGSSDILGLPSPGLTGETDSVCVLPWKPAASKKLGPDYRGVRSHGVGEERLSGALWLQASFQWMVAW